MKNNNILLNLIISRIKSARKEKNISQEKLSLSAGLESRYINKLENGNLNPTLNTIDKIIRALELSYEELFELELSDKNTLELLTLLSALEYTDRERVINAMIDLLTLNGQNNL